MSHVSSSLGEVKNLVRTLLEELVNRTPADASGEVTWATKRLQEIWGSIETGAALPMAFVGAAPATLEGYRVVDESEVFEDDGSEEPYPMPLISQEEFHKILVAGTYRSSLHTVLGSFQPLSFTLHVLNPDRYRAEIGMELTKVAYALTFERPEEVAALMSQLSRVQKLFGKLDELLGALAHRNSQETDVAAHARRSAALAKLCSISWSAAAGSSHSALDVFLEFCSWVLTGHKPASVGLVPSDALSGIAFCSTRHIQEICLGIARLIEVRCQDHRRWEEALDQLRFARLTGDSQGSYLVVHAATCITNACRRLCVRNAGSGVDVESVVQLITTVIDRAALAVVVSQEKDNRIPVSDAALFKLTGPSLPLSTGQLALYMTVIQQENCVISALTLEKEGLEALRLQRLTQNPLTIPERRNRQRWYRRSQLLRRAS